MNGALTGAYVAMYNHMQHEQQKEDVWKDFERKDFSKLDDNQRAQHITDAIKHSSEHGQGGDFNLNRIFSNLDNRQIRELQSVYIKNAIINAGGKQLQVTYHFPVFGSINNGFNGDVNFYGGEFCKPLYSRPGWYISNNGNHWRIGTYGEANHEYLLDYIGLYKNK